MTRRGMCATALVSLIILSSSSLLATSQTCQMEFDAQFLERRYSFSASDPWIDSTGSGNDLLAVNLDVSAILTSDDCPRNMGECISFQNGATSSGFFGGTAEHVTIPKLHTDDFQNGITYAFWVKFQDMPLGFGFPPEKNVVFSFFSPSAPTTNHAYFAGLPESPSFGDGTLYAPFHLQTQEVVSWPFYCVNAFPLPPFRPELCEEEYPIPGEWHHIAWAKSVSSGTQIYVDGRQLTDLGSEFPDSKHFEFGEFAGQIGASTRNEMGAYDFNGAVDDFRIYSTALTAAQVLELYNNNCTIIEDSSNVCSAEDIALCSVNAICAKSDGVATCECRSGFSDVNGDGSRCDDIDECQLEEVSGTCHEVAYCDNFAGGYRCVCPEGFLGDGTHCQSGSFGIRSVINFPQSTQLDLATLKFQYARALLPHAEIVLSSDIVSTLATSVGTTDEGLVQLTLNALFYTAEEAADTLEALTSPDAVALGGTIVDGPEVYRWVAQSTSDPVAIRPTGLTVDSVYFEPTCKQTGCWVVGVTYSKGSDNFNVFYLPRAEGRDDLSFDPDYSTVVPEWGLSPASTFSPANFPCGSSDYDPGSSLESGQIPPAVSACCLPAFLAMYRPVSTFPAALASVDLSMCAERPQDAPKFVKAGDPSDPASKVYEQPDAQSLVGGVFIGDKFSGMAQSEIVSAGVVDPFVGIFKAILYLDEKELRTQAGQLRGTVGVQHTVDTFVGLSSFSPTGIQFLDSSASQVALHLEKTDFFSVSSHGTNAYTFLEYVNMRLVAIYQQDTDQSESAAEMGERTSRTDSNGAAHYLQVTFTLGSQYKPNSNTGIVPLDSVRVGTGSRFPASTFMEYPCVAYVSDPPTFAAKDVFDARLPSAGAQQCAPNARMCVNPETIPDNFVSFNVPLGIDWLPKPSSDLSEKVYVQMVVSVVDAVQQEVRGANANNGDAPEQLKTTLTSTVPVVAGGVNVFCDGITAKTDLTDVVTVDLILGSASSSDELSRLQVMSDIGASVLRPQEPTEANSDSIESGLMTLVVQGNPSYFGLGGTGAYGINIEDVITLHIMESTGARFQAVQNLIAGPGDDNVASNQLDTDGYLLNEAFSFSVDRANNRAYLEPTAELLALCPFRPPRPSKENPFPSVCVLRRDIHRQEFAEAGQGSSQTAMEVDALDVVRENREDNGRFMQSILGASTYAYELGKDFSWAIAQKYALNGRFSRAIWIDPAYEWTPQQTGGQKRFALSQRIMMFCLVNLDEGWVRTGNANSAGRRMLLSSTQGTGAAVSSATVTHNTSPTYLFSEAFNLPEDKVAVFDVELRLTMLQACMDLAELRPELSDALVGHLSATASPIAAVHLLSVKVDKGPILCRRSLRGLKSASGWSEATARVEMLVMFSVHFTAALDIDRFATMPSVASISPATVPSSVTLGAFEPQEMDYWSIPTEPQGSASSGPSMNVGVLAAGIGGGVAMLLMGGILYYLYKQRQQHTPLTSEVIRAKNQRASLKAELQIPLEVVNVQSTLSLEDIVPLDPPKRKHKPPSLDFVELAGKKQVDENGARVSPVALARKQLVSNSIRDLDIPDSFHSSLTSDEMRAQLNDSSMELNNDQVMEI